MGCASAAGGGATGGAGGAAGEGGGGAGIGGGLRLDGGPRSSPDAPLPVDLAPDAPSTEFCAGYAAKLCDRLGGCSQQYLTWIYGTMATCQARFELECRGEAIAPGSGFSGAAAMACADAFAGATCDDVFGGRVPACQLTGTLPAGAVCGSDAQCSSGFCRTPETSFCGKCDARAAEGAACDSDAACEFPLQCSEAGRCARPAGEGELCNETSPCQAGPLFCGNDNICRRPSAEGKACNVTGNAPYQRCETGFACRPTAGGTCRPIRLVDAGLTCGISPTGSVVILCTGSGSCVNGTCRPPGQDGERCTTSPLGDSGGCQPPALCLEGLCKLPDPASCR